MQEELIYFNKQKVNRQTNSCLATGVSCKVADMVTAKKRKGNKQNWSLLSGEVKVRYFYTLFFL